MVTIYRIVNAVNGREYVGSTTNFSSRCSKHKGMLRRGIHRNRHLQYDYNEFGPECFSYEVIEEVSEDYRFEREQHWMDSSSNLYNILPVAGKARGRVHFEETKAKMSDSMRGRRPSDKTLKASADARRGKPMPLATRLKLSEAHKASGRRGSSSPVAKLTEESVSAILLRLYAGECRDVLAEEYGVSKSAIAAIDQGVSWRHVDGPRKHTPPRTTLTDIDVRNMLIRFRDGERGTVIAREYGISTASAYQIKNRKSWLHVSIDDSEETELPSAT